MLAVAFPGQSSIAAGASRPALAPPEVPAPELPLVAPAPPKALEHMLEAEKVAWGPNAPHELIRRRLLLPVEGVPTAKLTDSFFEPRPGAKLHEAIDIRAPRGTPVLAVEDAVVRRIKWHPRGGLTVYLYDSTGTYSYYFAHLRKLAPGLAPGCMVSRGEVIGYVGSTGSAPAASPHLHFEVRRLANRDAWWGGKPLNPFPALLAGETRAAPAPLFEAAD